MLICSVSARARRTVAVALTEAALAADYPAPGFSIFPLRVDDPASAGDLVDAYTGDIMVEAASAAAVVSAGVVYSLRVDEPANAVSVLSTAAGSGYTVSIAETVGASDSVAAGNEAVINEAATATSAQDATRVSAPAATALFTGGRSVVLLTPAPAGVAVLQSGTLLTVQ